MVLKLCLKLKVKSLDISKKPQNVVIQTQFDTFDRFLFSLRVLFKIK